MTRLTKNTRVEVRIAGAWVSGRVEAVGCAELRLPAESEPPYYVVTDDGKGGWVPAENVRPAPRPR